MNCTELRDHYELYALGLPNSPSAAKSGRISIADARYVWRR